MGSYDTVVGVAAALCTTASYVPQVRKSWQTGETGDLSLWMLFLLALGLALWLAYGLMRSDYVIVAANGASLAMLAVIIAIKVSGRARKQNTGGTNPGRARSMPW